MYFRNAQVQFQKTFVEMLSKKIRSAKRMLILYFFKCVEEQVAMERFGGCYERGSES